MVEERDVHFLAIHFKDGTIKTVPDNYYLCFSDEEGFEHHFRVAMPTVEAAFFLTECMSGLGNGADNLIKAAGGGPREKE